MCPKRLRELSALSRFIAPGGTAEIYRFSVWCVCTNFTDTRRTTDAVSMVTSCVGWLFTLASTPTFAPTLFDVEFEAMGYLGCSIDAEG